MIVLGFPGIGKSSICRGGRGFIDLDSSMFKEMLGNIDDTAWARKYLDIAETLSQQGNTVFVSTHEVVQKLMVQRIQLSPKDYSAVVYPSIHLRDIWLKRLLQRYLETDSPKDYNALVYMLQNYESSIHRLEETIPQDGWMHIMIKDPDYDLLQVLRGNSIMRYGEGTIEP